MHTHLHPVFEGILNNFAIPQTAAMDSYRRNLARHDWHYEYSDDARVWAEGRKERDALLAQKRELDPDWAIWNTYAPSQYRHTKATT